MICTQFGETKQVLINGLFHLINLKVITHTDCRSSLFYLKADTSASAWSAAFPAVVS